MIKLSQKELYIIIYALQASSAQLPYSGGLLDKMAHTAVEDALVMLNKKK